MSVNDPQPLWREVVGETEPWRRGRMFLILLGALTLCFQCLGLWLYISTADIEWLLFLSIGIVLFWLQFYFIWVGVHWVRWLSGGFNTIIGFIFLILGWRDSVGVAVLFGLYHMGAGLYLGLAPSVYSLPNDSRRNVAGVNPL
jgi:hypothetical protein